MAEHRLLTITGSPGIGKTRIAIEVARRIEDSYDETCFVDLLPIRDRDLVASQIALRLNVPVEGDDGLSGIIHHLSPRHTLLVIDNCEHVIADAAAVVQKLLTQCPSLTVLATSREALAHSAELIYRLPPMDSQTASELFRRTRATKLDPTWSVGRGTSRRCRRYLQDARRHSSRNRARCLARRFARACSAPQPSQGRNHTDGKPRSSASTIKR